jgi:hypothetical protein
MAGIIACFRAPFEGGRVATELTGAHVTSKFANPNTQKSLAADYRKLADEAQALQIPPLSRNCAIPTFDTGRASAHSPMWRRNKSARGPSGDG